jgi:hypothetical protein
MDAGRRSSETESRGGESEEEGRLAYRSVPRSKPSQKPVVCSVFVDRAVGHDDRARESALGLA